MEDLTHVHPVVKSLFMGLEIPHPVPLLAGRLKHFLPAWEKLTQDQEILSFVKGYEIPFLKQPFQEKPPGSPNVSQGQRALIDKEVEDLLRKGAIQEVSHCEGEYLSSIFLVPKKDGRQRPVINLKKLNKFVPYLHFKMEGFHCLKDMLQKDDYMCKIDMKDAYFSVPLHNSSKKYVRFQWSGKIYELDWDQLPEYLQNC